MQHQAEGVLGKAQALGTEFGHRILAPQIYLILSVLCKRYVLVLLKKIMQD